MAGSIPFFPTLSLPSLTPRSTQPPTAALSTTSEEWTQLEKLEQLFKGLTGNPKVQAEQRQMAPLIPAFTPIPAIIPTSTPIPALILAESSTTTASSPAFEGWRQFEKLEQMVLKDQIAQKNQISPEELTERVQKAFNRQIEAQRAGWRASSRKYYRRKTGKNIVEDESYKAIKKEQKRASKDFERMTSSRDPQFMRLIAELDSQQQPKARQGKRARETRKKIDRPEKRAQNVNKSYIT